MELEIKHLAPYLPYKIKGKSKNTGTIFTITGFNDRNSITTYGDLGMSDFEGTQLLLRPLSDLHDYFIPLFNSDNPDIFEYLSDEYLKDYGIDNTSEILNFRAEYLPYGLVNLLLKHSFDVFGLIPEGIALDINTLSI